jgi:hypothetical protein
MEQEQILSEIASLKERVTALEALAKGPQAKESFGKKMSLKEFLIERNPSGDVQKTIAIAFYLETVEKMQSFNRGDIEDGFRQAREKVPMNVSDKISMATKNGYFMEDKESKNNLKAWVLTNTGMKFVEGGFSK